jgi:cardiolipin synthase
MRTAATTGDYEWLCSGDEAFAAMLHAIATAQRSVRLETYTMNPGDLAGRFRHALAAAAARGVAVDVLLDGFGSFALPDAYLGEASRAGARIRIFNPLSLPRLGIRNHRKSLVCDERLAFIGGFNISDEYQGDGVRHGWLDIGLRIHGPLATELAAAFDDMFARADLRIRPLVRFRRTGAKRVVATPNQEQQLLLSGPGRGRNPIKSALHHDLANARDVRIMVAYLLPTWRIRRDLARVVARGGRVQLLLGGKSDVLLARLAAQSLYRRMLRAGIEIYEYQPQILHAKMIVIDEAVYVGSANLDQRSLNLNYEFLVRFAQPEIAGQARGVFEANRRHALQITRDGWRASRTWWSRLKQHWAYFFLVRVDPFIARRQWRRIPA